MHSPSTIILHAAGEVVLRHELPAQIEDLR